MITRRDFLKVTAAGGALASLGSVTEAKAAMKSAVPDEGFCHEGARKIPVIAEVYFVVAGGSSRAIAAAVAAHQFLHQLAFAFAAVVVHRVLHAFQLFRIG